MKISESQLRRLIAEVLVESSDSFKDVKKFAKATHREMIAPFKTIDESLTVIAVIMMSVMAMPEIVVALKAVEVRVLIGAAMKVYDIWFSASLLTDSLLRAVPLLKALRDGNKKRAFEMAFMIVCNAAELALFRQMTAAGRPIQSSNLARAIDSEKFKALGKVMKTVGSIAEYLGRSGIFNPRVSSKILDSSKSIMSGYAFMKLEMQKEDFAEALKENIFPDEIDWDGFEEETIRLDAQFERNSAETKEMISGMVEEIMKGQ